MHKKCGKKELKIKQKNPREKFNMKSVETTSKTKYTYH